MATFPSFDVTLADDTVQRVDIWPADIYWLEERIGKAVTDDLGFREVLTLTWLALKRTGRIDTATPLEDYVNTVKDFDKVADERPDPTSESPSTT
jgi:hypothetical protein